MAALLTTALLATALCACGGSSSNETVAVVAGASPIQKSLVEHWVPIEAVLSYRANPVDDVPKGVIPDPPDYSACIAYLKANPSPAESAEGPRTQAKVKARCAQKLKEIKRKVLGYMIAYRWVSGELQRRGLALTRSEANKDLRDFETNDYTPAEFHAYLAHSGETRADLRFIVEYTAMVTKLENDGLAKKSMSETEQREALADFTRRWTERTTCKPGYLVAGCKEYHGSETPL